MKPECCAPGGHGLRPTPVRRRAGRPPPILCITKYLARNGMQRLQRRAALGSEAIMQKWLRRIRGAIGMGVTWAAAWFAAGLVPRWVFGVYTDAPLPLVFGLFGLLAGVVFSGVLALTEGRRRFDQMSLPRFAAWGAVGGLLVSALFTRVASLGAGDVLAVAPAFAVACAVCATGSLALARRASRRELREGHGYTAGAELTDHEKRKFRVGGE